MEALVARHPTVLSRQRIAALSGLGFMNRRGIAGFVDKVTGSGR
jgi:hypothetical protein